MFQMHLISGIPDGWQGCESPPNKLNVKTGPLPSLYFGIYYSFGFSRLQGCGVGSPVIRLRLLVISIIRLQLRLRPDSDLQLYELLKLIILFR